MELILITTILLLIVYLIIQRIKEKREESFEDRDN